MILISLSIEKCVFSRRFGTTAHLSDLASSLETVFRDPVLYKLLTFHVPNLITIFCRLDHLSKESIQVWGSLEVFITSLFFTVKDC
jgi:hypothetical protein